MWRVLIVDDEKGFCSILSDYISKKLPLFEVSACLQDGLAAWQWIKTNPVDFIISDIRMPHMTGLELAKRVNDDHLNIPIIIISGYSDFSFAQKAIQYGVINYLLKPLDFAELKDTLSRLEGQLSRVRKDDPVESKVSLFLFYALAGLFGTKEHLLNAATLAEVPFDAQTEQIMLLEACLSSENCAWNDAVGKEDVAQILENEVKARFHVEYVYLIWEKGDTFYFIVIGSGAGNPAMAQRESAVFDCVRLRALASGKGIGALCGALADSPLKSQFSSQVSQNEISSDPLTDTIFDTDRQMRKSRILDNALTFIKTNIQQDLSREDVANAVFVSQSYLSHVFTEMAGMTFIECLSKLRIEKAVELLSQNCRVNEILERVGYRSRKAFLVNFRAFTGMTPSEYRQKYFVYGGENG